MAREKKPPTQDEILKYEIANELGLIDKVNSTGWKSLTARESGKIGGIMTKKKRAAAAKIIKDINNNGCED